MNVKFTKAFHLMHEYQEVFKALHPKWSAKVTSIEELNELTSLSLDELIGNLKVHELIIEKYFKIVKGKGETRSLTLKDKKESSDAEILTSVSKDEEYAMAVRDFKRRGRECLKPLKDKNQRAFAGGSLSDSGDDDDEKDRDKSMNLLRCDAKIYGMGGMDVYFLLLERKEAKDADDYLCCDLGYELRE
uniref:UBN2 domain-containing protein n=1 Tax=Tanacetum cinerariifolium TaxID=118510 RepID=A0A6L2J3E3_TANCI|nr:hypothetical protein [Tanacetum cinerariifolium]